MVDRHSRFSYRCNGCSRCCYKHIQLNPYEIARLARNRGVDSGAFLAAYAELGGSALLAMAVFTAPLLVGLLYSWLKGALEW